MKRRAFITLLGGAAAWPLAARAQQTAKLPTIGLMVPSTPLIESQRVAAFLQRLRQLGWIENRNVAIEYRWAEGRSERFAEIAAEFVQLKVDLIVASTTPAAIAAKQATATIPIVFATVNDPVSTGLIASLARPGGNLTGLSNQLGDTASKRLELLQEMIPGLRRLGIWANIGNPGAVLEMGEVQAAARTLALEVVTLEIRRAEDIGPAFEGAKGRADALYIAADPLEPRSHQHLGAGRAITNDARRSGVRRSGWPDVLWTKHRRRVSTRRRLCRQNSARGQAWRHSSRAADQVRSRPQPNYRQGARPRSAAFIACPRRRGDRMKRRAFITLLGGAAAVAWPLAARAQQQPVIRPLIGLLSPLSAATAARNVAAFRSGGISGKWLELLKQIAPGVTRASILR